MGRVEWSTTRTDSLTLGQKTPDIPFDTDWLDTTVGVEAAENKRLLLLTGNQKTDSSVFQPSAQSLHLQSYTGGVSEPWSMLHIHTCDFSVLTKYNLLSGTAYERDMWVSVTTAWRVLRLRMEERPPICRVPANTLNKQSRKPTWGGPPAWGVGVVLTTSHFKNVSCCEGVMACGWGNESSASHEVRGISWLAGNLLASQAGLCSME
jgi:hypothetical protein